MDTNDQRQAIRLSSLDNFTFGSMVLLSPKQNFGHQEEHREFNSTSSNSPLFGEYHRYHDTR